MVIAVRTETGPDGLEIVKNAESSAERSRLAAEAAVLTRAAHPGIVEVVSHRDGELRLRHHGTSLARLDQFPPDHAAAIVRRVAETVDAIHRQGIAHARIDADHVLVDRRGRPTLCGFGAAVPADAESTAADVAALGTLLDLLLDRATGRDWSEAHQGRRAAGRRKRAMAGFRLATGSARRADATQRPSARQFGTALADALPGLALPTAVAEPGRATIIVGGTPTGTAAGGPGYLAVPANIDPTADIGWSAEDLSFLADFDVDSDGDPAASLQEDDRPNPYAELADLEPAAPAAEEPAETSAQKPEPEPEPQPEPEPELEPDPVQNVQVDIEEASASAGVAPNRSLDLAIEPDPNADRRLDLGIDPVDEPSPAPLAAALELEPEPTGASLDLATGDNLDADPDPTPTTPLAEPTTAATSSPKPTARRDDPPSAATPTVEPPRPRPRRDRPVDTTPRPIPPKAARARINAPGGAAVTRPKGPTLPTPSAKGKASKAKAPKAKAPRARSDAGSPPRSTPATTVPARTPASGPTSNNGRRLLLVAVVVIIVGLIAGAAIARIIRPVDEQPLARPADLVEPADVTTTASTAVVAPVPTTAPTPSTTPPQLWPEACTLPALTGPDLDGDGCPEAVTIDDRTATVGTVTVELGQAGDLVAIADSDCDGVATPVLLRPSTGEIFRFDSWNTNEAVVVSVATVVPGARTIGTGPGACPAVFVTDGQGIETIVTDAA